MNDISDGKKAIETEVRQLAAKAGLPSITYTWVENGPNYYLKASFGDYYIDWFFSKVQMEESAPGNVSSYISRALRREISSILI